MISSEGQDGLTRGDDLVNRSERVSVELDLQRRQVGFELLTISRSDDWCCDTWVGHQPRKGELQKGDSRLARDSVEVLNLATGRRDTIVLLRDPEAV